MGIVVDCDYQVEIGGYLSMFMGEFQHSIDAKGRLIVPSKLREKLGEKFVVTRGLDGCLFGYPLSEWEKLEEKLNEMPLAKKDARTFVRFFLFRCHGVRDRQTRSYQYSGNLA